MIQTESAFGPEQATYDPLWGKYRGTVMDNADPLGLGRLIAEVPEALGQAKSGWAWPCVPYAGPNAGFYAVPPVGAGVWIEFEGGNTSRPVWSGCYWAEQEPPVVPPADNGKVQPPETRIWRTDKGLTFAYDDSARSITITDVDATNRIVIDVPAGTITVKGLTHVVLETPHVELGSASAFHPGVFGDVLVQYLTEIAMIFNTHVHPGELVFATVPVTPAPTATPMQPPSGLLSGVVTLD